MPNNILVQRFMLNFTKHESKYTEKEMDKTVKHIRMNRVSVQFKRKGHLDHLVSLWDSLGYFCKLFKLFRPKSFKSINPF